MEASVIIANFVVCFKHLKASCGSVPAAPCRTAAPRAAEVKMRDNFKLTTGKSDAQSSDGTKQYFMKTKNPIAFCIAAFGALALCSCSDDKDDLQKVNIPLDQVTLQSATPDNATVNAPAVATADGSKITYANGQTLTFAGNATGVTLTSIEGICENVIVPAAVTINGTSYNVTAISIPAVYGDYNESVKTITLPATVSANASTFQSNLNYYPNLEQIVLAVGFGDFSSIAGAVYTSDLKTIVYCPRGRKGSFSIANGTETVASGAFDPESYVERVVVPASVTEIEDEAFMYNKSLQVVNMLGKTAPVARKVAFGYYARRATLVIPSGSTGYRVSAPAANADETAVEYFENHEGYTFFETVSEVNYNL